MTLYPRMLIQPQADIDRHWRYISAFHGPWLQLPHEILETLAHSNFLSPRPRQTDPGVLYDLLKIRKLVDEAANLAVRAQNGTASSALSNNDSLPGGSLGLSTRGGGQAKLSAERKYRMRELATQKLSQAYRLDEIAASVATMQSASTLDSVSNLVLQRAPSNTDALYVHFFHEKIPSRMMAQYTSLEPLDQIISHQLDHAAPWRTRALTRIFHEDHHGAIGDLTEAMALSRVEQSKHTFGRTQLMTMKEAREQAERRKVWTKDWVHEHRVAEQDQPRSMDMQLLFQRGNQYLTVASKHIRLSLDHFREAERLQQQADAAGQDKMDCNGSHSLLDESNNSYRQAAEAREAMRRYAKRALRDYTTFLGHLDYAHAPAHLANEDLFTRADLDGEAGDRYQERASAVSSSSVINGSRRATEHSGNQDPWTDPPVPTIYQASDLLCSTPPITLPTFSVGVNSSSISNGGYQEHHEMVTYHPLLPETLHSLLLAHCLLQTPTTTMNRIATNAARLARLADGYPFFLSARSPARADWSEILRKTNNWINVAATWDHMCQTPASGKQNAGSPPVMPAVDGTTSGVDPRLGMIKVEPSSPLGYETADQKRERIHKKAVMDALGDERVVDDDTFARAVSARERRAWRDEENEGSFPVSPASTSTDSPTIVTSGDALFEPSSASTAATAATSMATTPVDMRETKRAELEKKFGISRRAVVSKDEEYLIGTQRATDIARWVLEAPSSIDTSIAGLPARLKKRAKAKKPKAEVKVVTEDVDGLCLD